MKAACAFLCGGVTARVTGSRNVIDLNLRGPSPNVTLTLDGLMTGLRLATLPPPILDLIEIATYVWVADQTVKRGDEVASTNKTQWRRDLEFHIPVRNPDLWQSDLVRNNLTALLTKLTEDDFAFHFTTLDVPTPTAMAESIDLPGIKPAVEPKEIVLLSGGLDSLCGAVDSVINHERHCVLVSHSPSTMHQGKQTQLVDRIAHKAGHRNFVHVQAVINKDEELTKDYTQRSRSFLFGALAVSVARLLNLPAVTFYENGVTAMNLIASEQLTGARASRTCHPVALRRMEALFESVLGARTAIVNPFLWCTKAEILERLKKADCLDLIEDTISCTRVRWRPEGSRPQCGWCIQCIHRRFAILAAGLGAHENEDVYDIPLATGRRNSFGLTTAETYLRRAREYRALNDPGQFLAAVGNTLDILDSTEREPRQSLQAAWTLHRAWSREVEGVRAALAKEHSDLIGQSCVPADTILSMIVETAVADEAVSTARRIQHPLRRLIPISEVSHKPGHKLLKALLEAPADILLLTEIEKLGQSASLDRAVALRTAYERITEAVPEATDWIKQRTLRKNSDEEPGLILLWEHKAPRKLRSPSKKPTTSRSKRS